MSMVTLDCQLSHVQSWFCADEELSQIFSGFVMPKYLKSWQSVNDFLSCWLESGLLCMKIRWHARLLPTYSDLHIANQTSSLQSLCSGIETHYYPDNCQNC